MSRHSGVFCSFDGLQSALFEKNQHEAQWLRMESDESVFRGNSKMSICMILDGAIIDRLLSLIAFWICDHWSRIICEWNDAITDCLFSKTCEKRNKRLMPYDHVSELESSARAFDSLQADADCVWIREERKNGRYATDSWLNSTICWI